MESLAIVDAISVESLHDRYNLGKTQIYQRLKTAGVTPFRGVGGKSFVSANDLAKLDRLHQSIVLGDMAAPNEQRTEITTDGWGVLTEVLAAINSAPADPMQNHRYLHEAAVNGWLLSTPLLRSLVGIRPQGQSFHRMGFKFDRVGREWRVQAWWIQSIQGQ